MERTHGPEITFSVHPRQEREEPIGRANPLPIPARIKPTPSFSVPEVPDYQDTFIGDLVFLVRFAFGLH